MEIRNDHNWKEDIPAFREKTAAFYAGELSKDAYKGFSGLYGSYAQKGGKAIILIMDEELVGRRHYVVACLEDNVALRELERHPS